MKNLVKHVQNENALHSMWCDHDTIIIGVSGGPDSMCLLDIMVRIAKKESLKIIVAHVNYGLRESDADKDQQLVEKTAKKYDLLCEVYQCKKNIQKSEDHLRTVRYDFFFRVKEKYSAQRIAVGHNKNDQAETLLLHLLRGTGLGGLAGMRFASDRNIIRPLLSVERKDIVAYCIHNAIPYHIDVTNFSSYYTRNKIRNVLIPLLEKEYNPQIITSLARTADMVASDLQCIDHVGQIIYKKSANGSIAMSKKKYLHEPIALQRRILMMIIMDLCGSTNDVDKSMIDEMRKVIQSTKSKNQVFATKDLKMMVKGDRVILACP